MLEKLPFEVTSRYLAAYFEVNNKKCSDYIDLAVTDVDKRNTICTEFDFSNLDNVKVFLGATYYGGSYLDNLKDKTKMTDDELAILFDATDQASFQYAYLSQNQILHDFFKCTSYEKQCSDDDLA